MSRNRAPTAATKFGTSKYDLPPPKSEPLPLYPLLETKPAPLDLGEQAQYLADTERSLISIFRKSSDHLELPAKKPKIERFELSETNKNDHSESKNSFEHICGDINPDIFPEELLPRKSLKRKSRKSKFDRIVNLLDDLEDEENKISKRANKNRRPEYDIKPSTSEVAEGQAGTNRILEEEEDEDAEQEDEDEEKIDEEENADDDEDLEAGGDYIDSYFDNGEGYEDNDDDGDEGPMY